MSFFSKLFKGKKGAPTPSASEAIQKLRELEEMLEKKSKFLENKIAEERALVKKYGTKNKKAAIQALKKMKRYEKTQQALDGTLTTIELQRMSLEDASTNTSVLQSMKNASDALKGANLHMNVDQVQDMMDDIADQQEIASGISDAISQPTALHDNIDEDELEKELEELEQDALDEQLLSVDSTIDLPAIPAAKEPAKKTKPKHATEDKDLKKLEAWAT